MKTHKEMKNYHKAMNDYEVHAIRPKFIAFSDDTYLTYEQCAKLVQAEKQLDETFIYNKKTGLRGPIGVLQETHWSEFLGQEISDRYVLNEWFRVAISSENSRYKAEYGISAEDRCKEVVKCILKQKRK